MHKKNLMLLADHLATNVANSRFDMQNTRFKTNRFKIKDPCFYAERKEDRGDGGSALGHAPFVKELHPKSWEFKQLAFFDSPKILVRALHFECYLMRVFNLKINSDRWAWCFYNWAGHPDNTPLGAALRIEYLVQNGLPKNFIAQMTDEEPLCYQKPVFEPDKAKSFKTLMKELSCGAN